MLIFNNNNLRISIHIWTQTIMLLFGPTTKIFGQTIAGSDALFAILHEHHFFEAVACWGKQCDLYFCSRMICCLEPF
jgi:hypothetical protein